jgi:hypothetical protein
MFFECQGPRRVLRRDCEWRGLFVFIGVRHFSEASRIPPGTAPSNAERIEMARSTARSLQFTALQIQKTTPATANRYDF